MSNEYKDYYTDKERGAREFFFTLRDGRYPIVDLDELEYYMPMMYKYGAKRLIIEQASWDHNKFIIGVDNETLGKWNCEFGRKKADNWMFCCTTGTNMRGYDEENNL